MEGPTRRKHIVELRRRQAKNMFASLLLSQGTPMIVAGDEILRTQRGNNNAYCQDNATSWFDWKRVTRNAEMLRFAQAVIDFRKTQPVVRRASFLTGVTGEEGGLPDVSWYGPSGTDVDWMAPSRSLLCVYGTDGLDDPAARNVMVLLHAGQETQEFIIPEALRNLPWRQFIDTAAETPADVHPDLDGPILPADCRLKLPHHTLMCYVA